MAVLSLVSQITGWLFLVAVLLVPGVVATFCWSPFLVSKRVRSLFERLPPFDSVLATYVLYGVAASLPYVLGLVGALVAVDVEAQGGGVRLANAMLNVTFLVSVVYVVGFPLVGAAGLPRLGVDWDPTDYGVSTWALLAAGAVWYSVLFVVPVLVLSALLSLPGGY